MWLSGWHCAILPLSGQHHPPHLKWKLNLPPSLHIQPQIQYLIFQLTLTIYSKQPLFSLWGIFRVKRKSDLEIWKAFYVLFCCWAEALDKADDCTEGVMPEALSRFLTPLLTHSNHSSLAKATIRPSGGICTARQWAMFQCLAWQILPIPCQQ